MTNEQIEQTIKELQEMKKLNIKEQKKKEREEQKKIKAKNDKKIIGLVRLVYADRTDDEIIDLFMRTIREKQPAKTEQAEKILNK